MKAFRIILIVIGAIIALALILAAFLPAQYSIKRSIVIKKPAFLVYDKIAKYSNWEKWSPWKPLDVDAKYTFTGKDGEVGSKIAWNGDTVGTGYMEMKKLDEFKLVHSELVFQKPWEMHSDDYFTLEEKNSETNLTWTDEGKLAYPLGRLFSLFMNAEKMMGPDFEKGLKNIKKIVEEGIDISMVELPLKNIYYVSLITTMNTNEIQQAFASAYGELDKFCKDNKIQMNGEALAINNAYDKGTYVFDAAFTVKDNSAKPTGRVRAGTISAGKYVKGVHIGPYQYLTESYKNMMAYINKNKLVCIGKSFESYINDPMSTKQEKLITHIFFPVK